MNTRVWAVVVAWLALAGGAAAQNSTAQDYPARPLALIVPYPPGGPTDALARIVAGGMRASLGQPIVIENVSGAGGSIGVGRLARAAPDGYTFSIGQLNSNVFSGAIYATSYDLLRDFEPIALLASSPQWLLARKDFPASSLAELIAWLKANPDNASYGTIGNGSPSHLWGLNFQASIETRLKFVPYRGGAPQVQDLVAGHIDITVTEASHSLPQLQSGTVKAYAVLTPTRWRMAPDVPTVTEAGASGQQLPFWHGMWAPKGAADGIVARLNRAVIETLEDPAIRQRLIDMGQEIFPRDELTPAALAAAQKAAIEKWWPIIKAARIKPD